MSSFSPSSFIGWSPAQTPSASASPTPEPEKASEVEPALLSSPISASYRPRMPIWSYEAFSAGLVFQFIWRDLEAMLLHPHVSWAYECYKAGISHAEFKVVANSPEVQRFVEIMIHRFWERSLEQCQLSYDYGWNGYEICYARESGYLTYSHLDNFMPFDVWALTAGHKYVGIKVTNVPDEGGAAVLWGPRRWPAKGFFFSHNRRFNKWYGRSHLISAYRPWRRLGIRDAAEEIVDACFYRFGYRGPILRYPVKAYAKRGTSGSSSNEADFEVSRENARQYAEQIKAGASAAFPNTWNEKAGKYEWDLESMEPEPINLGPMLEYPKYLKDEISVGIGVPPELLQAAETGSGYSGRKIPLQVFYNGQQKNARALTWACMRQILIPLVHWNFGPKARFEVEVEVTLPKALSAPEPGGAQGPQPGQPAGPPGAAPKQGGASGAGPVPPSGKGAGAPTAGKPPAQGGKMLSTLPFDLDPPAEPEAPPDPFAWLEIVLRHAPHTRILGPTGAGKTTLAQVIAAHAPGQLAFIDPVWEPSTWGGLPAATINDDGSFAPVRDAMELLLKELLRRISHLKRGNQQFEPLWIIWDEVPNTVLELERLAKKDKESEGIAGQFVRLVTNYGRHVNMHLVGMGQSGNVGAWGIESFGDTAENFCTIYLGHAAVDKDRSLAGIDHPAAIEWQGELSFIDMQPMRQAGEVDAQKVLAKRRGDLFPLPGVGGVQPLPAEPKPTEAPPKAGPSDEDLYKQYRQQFAGMLDGGHA